MWTEGTDTRGVFPECSVMWENPETLLISDREVGREAPVTVHRILLWSWGMESLEERLGGGVWLAQSVEHLP